MRTHVRGPAKEKKMSNRVYCRFDTVQVSVSYLCVYTGYRVFASHV